MKPARASPRRRPARPREGQLGAALLHIAQEAATATDLGALCAAIHRIIGELMPAVNCYLALYDPGADELHFPYYLDEMDAPPPPQRPGRGLTEYVLRSGEPLLVDRKRFAAMVADGSIAVVGTPAVDWLGVPLRGGGRTFGVLAVQSYRREVRYGERDKEVLTFVSQHIAAALERKRADEERERSLSLLRATLESTADGILVVDRGGRVQSSNRKFREMWRIPPALIDSGDDNTLLAFVLDQLVDPDGFLAKVRELYDDDVAESFDVLEFRDGRVFERYSQPRRVAAAVVGRVWSFRDVTAQRQLEEQLRQAQKMEAVGQLAGGVAHDFNNLLTVVFGYCDLLLARLAPGDPMRADVEEVRNAGRRAGELTRQLLAFGRRQVLSPRPIDLNGVVVEMEKLLRRLIGEHIELVIRLDDQLAVCAADPGQIEQVILNLAVNARDAMPRGGRLLISTANVEIDAEEARRHLVAPEAYVLLRVSDTGVGMEESVRRRIFEPFFTTKELGQGTGLGLATVYGIVKQSGGHVAVDSQPGAGSVFSVYLPRVAGRAEPAARSAPSGAPSGEEAILLVEDEDAVRGLVARVLRELGYRVLEARDGAQALEVAAQAGAFDLLLTDIVMPRVGGLELAARLRVERPELPVLLVSGHSEQAPALLQSGALGPRVAFLQKPYSTDDLARRLRQLLD